jgi:hypothetical protein
MAQDWQKILSSNLVMILSADLLLMRIRRYAEKVMRTRTNRTEKLDLRLTATAKQALQSAAEATHKTVSDSFWRAHSHERMPRWPTVKCSGWMESDGRPSWRHWMHHQGRAPALRACSTSRALLSEFGSSGQAADRQARQGPLDGRIQLRISASQRLPATLRLW